MHTGQPLHVVIADEHSEALDETEKLLGELGHVVVARETEIGAAADAAERCGADAAVVSVRDDKEHALELVERVSDTAPCPVVVLLLEENPGFVEQAAERGLLAYANRERPESLEAALALARRRFEEMRELGGQLREMEAGATRRAKIEQAKGILMERHGVGAVEAFEMLRQAARKQRRRTVEIAEAVIDARPLLATPDGGEDPDA